MATFLASLTSVEEARRAGSYESPYVDGGVAQRILYEQSVGHEVRNLYTEGPGAIQWGYKLPGAKVPNKEFLHSFTRGAKPVKTQASLPPLDRIKRAAVNRKRAEAEYRKALKDARTGHTLRELAAAAGVTRQRVSQILAT